MDSPTCKACVVWIDPIRDSDDFATSCRGRVEDVSTSVRVPFAGAHELLALVERVARAARPEDGKREDSSDG